MSAPTVPISEAPYRPLQGLAEQTGQTTLEVLDKALGACRRKLFFERLNAGYAESRADSEAWAEYLAERPLRDATLMDGLDPDEHWTEDGRCVTLEEGRWCTGGGDGRPGIDQGRRGGAGVKPAARRAESDTPIQARPREAEEG